LIAYKNFDNNHYSLVPGISPIKKIAERSRGGTVPDEQLATRAMSLDKYNVQ
jgi:hypothetical protein